MPAIAREQASNCNNPILDIFTQVNGQLLDVYRLEYQIFDVSDPEKRVAPVQVHPLTPGERALVNPALCSAGGGKVSTGHYVAGWTAPADASIGTHEIRWFFKLTPSSPEQTFAEDFEVLVNVSGFSSDGYCLVSDLRREGVTVAEASDDRIQRLIDEASALIDKYTGFHFKPEERTYYLDSYGTRTLQLDEPIIGLEAVWVNPVKALELERPLDQASYRVYNRHLSQRLRSPDDRYNPKIELVAPFRRSLSLWNDRWPEGRQNIAIRGVFGFTDPDGSPNGRTPAAIRHVCMLLVMREIPLLTDTGTRQDALQRWRLAEEKTRDQSYRLTALKPRSGDMIFTGDSEIDSVLSSYSRPMGLGAA